MDVTKYSLMDRDGEKLSIFGNIVTSKQLNMVKSKFLSVHLELEHNRSYFFLFA